MADIADRLAQIVGHDNVLIGDAIGEEYTHDEALTVNPVRPIAVVRPSITGEVSEILRTADEMRIPVTARGGGTGLSGGCIPRPNGILVSSERMNRILEIDSENLAAVVQPGVTLAQLDEATAAERLVYPVFPGENSATLGGNIATNAGGMRAVKYGVTRHQVLGVEAVLANGSVIRTGGKYVKSSTGYDLTQLIVGSEGTLAMVTEAVLRLYPRPPLNAMVLAPFRSLEEVTTAVAPIISGGLAPLLLEYMDSLSLVATTREAGIDLGIPGEVKDEAVAYLMVVLEGDHPERLDEDVARLSTLLVRLGALDVYVPPPPVPTQLLRGRERVFWVAKRKGVNDVVDVVVPRASIPRFLAAVNSAASESGSFVAGTGHAGDGNVHLSVFQPDVARRKALMRQVFREGIALGGTISAEHGIGLEKKEYLSALEDPAKIELMRGIKRVFDPHGILNPGAVFD